MSSKQKRIKERIDRGNLRAQRVAEYITRCTGYVLEQTSLDEDMRLKLDFRNPISGRTFQIKVRDERQDFIHETHKFKQFGQVTPRTNFDQQPGRDAVCQADFYVNVPCPKVLERRGRNVVMERQRIEITRTEFVKNISDTMHEDWGVCQITNEMIYEWWRRGDHCVHAMENGCQIWFKIDEGSDTEPYGKLLSFVSRKALEEAESNVVVIETLNGEELFCPDTWKTKETTNVKAT